MKTGSVNEQNLLYADSVAETECRLIKSALFGTELSFLPDTDWGAVYKELYSQTIESIPAELLSKLPIDIPLRMEWKKSCLWRISNFYQILQAQSEMVRILKKENIDFVILKGTAAAMYYPCPQYRTMGDIDFLVDPDQFNRAYEILIANGFVDTDGEFGRHKNLTKYGCEFEMHKYFSLQGASGELKQLDRLIFYGIKEAEMAEIDGNEFPVLPRLQNGLTLLQHIKHHLRRSLGMRQILDWMLFVDKCLDDEFWETKFKVEAERAGLEKLAVAVTRMCQIYLGLSENITWCNCADDELCHELFNHVVVCGNMGNKRTDTLQKAFDYKGGPIEMLKNLQKSGKSSWKVLEKLPFLVVFAWLYQLCHYIKSAFKHHISPVKLIKYSKFESETVDMFGQLGCPDDIVGN